MDWKLKFDVEFQFSFFWKLKIENLSAFSFFNFVEKRLALEYTYSIRFVHFYTITCVSSSVLDGAQLGPPKQFVIPPNSSNMFSDWR